MRRLRRAVAERSNWLLLREQRIRYLEDEVERLQARIRERDDWLLLREQRIAEVEGETEHVQLVAREREHIVRARENEIATLEKQVRELENYDPGELLQIQIDERDAIIRQREARIRSLEIEVRSRVAELDLFRGALDQAEEVLRKRHARLTFLERPPEALDVTAVPPGSSGLAYPDETAPAAIIAEWMQAAPDFAKLPLCGGQELVDPYVLEKPIHGCPTRLLIVTRQAQHWYDRFDLTEGPYVEALKMVRPGGTVFDCGAHHGVNSLLYSRMVGASGQVFAFDPFPMNIKIGTLNAQLNNRDNINFINVALSSDAGQLDASVAEQCISLENQTADDMVSLQLAPLDRFADLRPDFIKMDVEGAEIDALEGASRILASKPSIYLELHPSFLPSFNKRPMDVFKLISLYDYLCFVNYPGRDALLRYELEFELTLPCALFFLPKDQNPVCRYYTTSKAPPRSQSYGLDLKC